MHQLIYISEQHQRKYLTELSDQVKLLLVERLYYKNFYYKPELMCFQLYNEAQIFSVDSNYFIGVDWLLPQKVAIYVEPKLNKETQQVDFLGMLLQCLEAPENLDHLDDLYHAEYDEAWISVPEQKDLLSPILIVQFLKLVHKIVQKGLKKSYYRVTANLDSKVKGKILVGQQIKFNIAKNRFKNTICNYQEYGINSFENQYLKLVLLFVSSWLNQKEHFFNKQQRLQLLKMLSYCQPAFEKVDVLNNKHQKIITRKNIFYKEYEDAVKIGGYILKRFSFNINKISTKQAHTPPFWIDMSKLFELYVFQKLKNILPEPGLITYHDKFNKKETDILIRAEEYKCVVDCKYKPQYENGSPSLEDKRQLAGYTRLKSVYTKLNIPFSEIVKGVIIYSHQDSPKGIKKEDIFKTPIGEYVDFFKIGISLPILE